MKRKKTIKKSVKQVVSKKRYIVRKYIMARSCEEALSIEKKYKPDDCFIDSDWEKNNSEKLVSAIGFTTN